METSKHGSRRGMLMVMAASALWGTSGLASQFISQMVATTPLSISFLRLALAAPVLLLAGQRLVPDNKMWSIAPRDLALMLLMGILIAFDQALYFAAVASAGVAVSTLVAICAAPLLVNLVTAFSKRRRPDNGTLFLLLLAVIGTGLLVIGGKTTEIESVSLIGVALALGAGCAYAGVLFTSRTLAERCYPIQVTAVTFTIAALLLAVAAAIGGFVGTYPLEGRVLLIYMGLIPTALAYSLFVVGMRSTAPSIASVLVLLEPLTATLLSWLLLPAEKPGLTGIIGTVLLLSAIFWLSRRET